VNMVMTFVVVVSGIALLFVLTPIPTITSSIVTSSTTSSPPLP
jgi:hypothetical protein